MRCPRCQQDSKDGTIFCIGCGAPLALRPEPAPRALDASLSLDRRAAARAAAATPLELAETQADLTLRLPAPPPALDASVVASATPSPAPGTRPPFDSPLIPSPSTPALRAYAQGGPSRGTLGANGLAAPSRAAPAPIPDGDRSHWDLGSALDGGSDRTFAPEAPRPADDAWTGPIAAPLAPPLVPPAPLERLSEPAGFPGAPIEDGPEPGGPARAALAPEPEPEPEPGAALDPALPDAEVDALEIHLRKAPTWRRTLAWALDGAPFGVLLAWAVSEVSAGEGASFPWGLAGRLVADGGLVLPLVAGVAILFLVYQTLCHALSGATLGKWLCRLRVAGPDGRRPGFGRSAARAALSVLSGALLGLGLLLPLFTVSGRALHDLLAGTWVVEAP